MSLSRNIFILFYFFGHSNLKKVDVKERYWTFIFILHKLSLSFKSSVKLWHTLASGFLMGTGYHTRIPDFFRYFTQILEKIRYSFVGIEHDTGYQCMRQSITFNLSPLYFLIEKRNERNKNYMQMSKVVNYKWIERYF